jgi:hypothetical protein
MLRRVALVGTDVSEELSATQRNISEDAILHSHRRENLKSYVPSSPILVTRMLEALSSSETSVLTRETWHNIPEGAILHSHHRENLCNKLLLDLTWTTQKTLLYHTAVVWTV